MNGRRPGGWAAGIDARNRVRDPADRRM